ncbi:MAG: flagellar export protein FliJ [Clostridiales bacterium]|nr:flagellar export protein FliJ [Clostridiales bacterium]
MKKFVFKLAKVKSFKEQTLEVKKGEMLNLQQKLSEIENRIKMLNNQYSETNKQMLEKMEDGISPGDISSYKTFLGDLDIKIRRSVTEKRRMLELIELKRLEIVEVNSEISGLERLRDKQYAEYLKETAKEQETAIEEFVSQGHGNMQSL